MRKNNVLLIIDPQEDFCNPAGSLYVKGADEDMQRLQQFIIKNKFSIDHIITSGDWHQVNHIGHPSFWWDINGNNPKPFTSISYADVIEKKWRPGFFEKEAVAYIKALEQQGEFSHFIWPHHCIQGTSGASLTPSIASAIKEWCETGHFFEFVTKGTCSVAEHYGIFRANIQLKENPETHLNQELLFRLDQYENILIAGEAKSHCVGNSIKQIMEEAPAMIQKITLLEDCMSDVEGLSHLGNPIYEKARQAGIQHAKSTEFIIS